MIIGFTGHRDRTCPPAALDAMRDQFPGAVWLHGGATGFDSQVEEYAKAHSIETRVIRPDYARYGSKMAPLRRNEEIVAQCDLLVACFDGRQKGGTFFTIGHARQIGRRLVIVAPMAKTPAAPH